MKLYFARLSKWLCNDTSNCKNNKENFNLTLMLGKFNFNCRLQCLFKLTTLLSWATDTKSTEWLQSTAAYYQSQEQGFYRHLAWLGAVAFAIFQFIRSGLCIVPPSVVVPPKVLKTVPFRMLVEASGSALHNVSFSCCTN